MSAFVDWDLAGKIAAAASGDGPARMEGVDLERIGERSGRAVLAYTGLRLAEPTPAAEWVSRRQWAALNLTSLRELISPIEDRLGTSLPGAAGEAVAAVGGRLLAAEIGGLLGVASRRVLGQYEYSLRGEERPPRLVLVGANIEQAAGKLGGERSDVLEWVALHEGTHAAHFGAAPWLRGHLGRLSAELVEGLSTRISPTELLKRATRATSADPRRALAGLRASDPMTLLAPAATRATIEQVQAAMAAIEGYAEHVMDAAPTGLDAVVPKLRDGIEERREGRNPLLRLISWLLGFEMKLRQYRDGKRFADEVVGRAGIDGLNRAWSGPAALPSLRELSEPVAWIERTSPV